MSAQMQKNRPLNQIKEFLNTITSELTDISLKIHSNPEISFEEVEACKQVAKFAEKHGAKIWTSKDISLKTALVAEFPPPTNLPDYKTIGVCSEYDALPDIGHACGHNLIAIVGLATAVLLHKYISANNLPAQVKLFGTPAEERTGGKVFMLKAGDFEKVDLAIMAHPGNENLSFPNFMALASFKVHFYGKASHAAGAPWDGINALDAAVAAYNAIAMLRQQCKPDARIHGIIEKGGSAPNIIPDHTSMYFYVRSNDAVDMTALLEKVKCCCTAAAASTGCTLEFQDDPQLMNTKQDPKLAILWRKWMLELGNHFRNDSLTKMEDVPLLKLDEGAVPRGSTDMGNVLWAFPGIHPMFNIFPQGSSTEGTNLHTITFREAAKTPYAFEKAFDTSVALALSSLEYLFPSRF